MEPVKNIPICALCTHTPICKNQPQESCPYLQLKEDKKSPEQKSPKVGRVKPKRSILRTIKLVMIWIVVIISIIAAFVVGRVSTYPRLVSLIPSVSQPVKPGLSPEDVVYKFYRYARLHEVDNLMSVSHPELVEEHNWRLTDIINDGPTRLAGLQEVKIVSVQAEETALATISLLINEHTHSMKVSLKKHQGEWRVVDFDGYW